jgi:hypothetical protein
MTMTEPEKGCGRDWQICTDDRAVGFLETESVDSAATETKRRRVQFLTARIRER